MSKFTNHKRCGLLIVVAMCFLTDGYGQNRGQSTPEKESPQQAALPATGGALEAPNPPSKSVGTDQFSTFSVKGIRLGMSVDEVKALFPKLWVRDDGHALVQDMGAMERLARIIHERRWSRVILGCVA